jgi:hypothetical protein
MAEQLVRNLATQRLRVHVPEHAQLELTRLLMASFDAHDNFGVLRTATAQNSPDDPNGRRLVTCDFRSDARDGVDGQRFIRHVGFLPHLMPRAKYRLPPVQFTEALHDTG